MHRIVAALLFSALIFADRANASAQRTFVSTTGIDSNTASNCSVTMPCRGFSAALTVTNIGGEIVVLGSGGYGTVTIGQSVAVRSPPGVYAGISVFSGTGIAVNAAGVIVTLQGLTITGLGGTRAIDFSAGTRLRVDRCEISGFGGLPDVGLSSLAAAADLYITDSIFSGNALAIYVSDLALLHIERTRVEDSSGVDAVTADSVANTVVRDSTIVRSGTNVGQSALRFNANVAGNFRFLVSQTAIADTQAAGIIVFNGASGANISGSVVQSALTRSALDGVGSGAIRLYSGALSGKISVAVADSVVSGNIGAGIELATSNTTVTVSRSTVADNGGVAFSNSGGTAFYSRLDNTVRGNNGQELAGQTSGTITTLPAL